MLPAKLVLIGDGPDRSECERLTRETAFTEGCHFFGKTGWIARTVECGGYLFDAFTIGEFRIGCVGKQWRVVVPVVSSSVGGLPELNIHNQTGFIAEIGDIEIMAKYTLQLLQNEKRYTIFSQNARERAAQHFDTRIVVPRYLDYYEKVLSGNKEDTMYRLSY